MQTVIPTRIDPAVAQSQLCSKGGGRLVNYLVVPVPLSPQWRRCKGDGEESEKVQKAKSKSKQSPKNKTRGSSKSRALLASFCGSEQPTRWRGHPCACARLHDGLLGFLGLLALLGTSPTVTRVGIFWGFAAPCCRHLDLEREREKRVSVDARVAVYSVRIPFSFESR
ncbi:hypothetical protein CCMA1212_009635 [Trichoderma ghanense]|uniref:Uncharacterized protein n=1 Tax=Trichoderma ghanense TaxID=65468 RepID=A0ABY2GT95_9HYPO